MDFSIGQNQQDLVDVGSPRLICIAVKGLQHVGELGWAGQLDSWQLLLVGRHDVLDAKDGGVCWVGIQWETVLDCGHAWRDSTESEGWEPFVKVIGLDDLTNRLNSLDVLVVVALVMEGAGVLWVSI